MINIILAGGSGTRLWPISRTLLPKQFVRIFDDKSLFMLTALRNSRICDETLIISNENQYFLALDQLGQAGLSAKYFLEPMPRNTAGAIALACLAVPSDEIVLVTPADHLIKDETEYAKSMKIAQDLAQNDALVTFGIKPSYAHTGFGYIEMSENYAVKAFHEKPDESTAKKYVESENYFWNSGIFMFKACVYLKELETYAPEILKASQVAYESAKNEENVSRILADYMEKIPENSIDYAVLEKSNNVKVVPSDFAWSDLGSFEALHDELEKDENSNTICANHITIGSKNNFVYCDNSAKSVVTIDMEDTIIADTGDALLVGKMSSAQKVKKTVEILKQKGSALSDIHQTVFRPWGSYTVLLDTPGYKLKKLEVKPGKRLSLQKHMHRNEHWIVVSGTATVSVAGETKLVRPNESTYIKMGQEHRLANEGKIPVVIIEAQVGEYTGEDDIIRIEDDFKRISNSLGGGDCLNNKGKKLEFHSLSVA